MQSNLYLKFLQLETKSFFRKPQLGVNIALKILMFIGLANFAFMYIGAAFLLFFISKEEWDKDPIHVLTQYFMYYWMGDLLIRYIFQTLSSQNIKPLLTQNITKNQLVNYSLWKSFFHFSNFLPVLFVLTFAGISWYHGYSILGILGLSFGILAIIWWNNFLNILLNKKTVIALLVGILFSILIALEYLKIFSLSTLSDSIFYPFYLYPLVVLLPIVLLIGTVLVVKNNIKKGFYLDEGLALTKAVGKTENIAFLNKFGVIGTFLNNDVRMLKRSKAAQSAVFSSILFLFYGLLSYMSVYSGDFMKFFTAIFVTGGFVFVFAQNVPAWDSSYYPLMMTQNVPYKKYLQAKWSLVVLATIISLVLAVFYAFLNWEYFLVIVAAGFYNIGVNSYITLLAGAYNKKPVDLNSRTKSLNGGGLKNLNFKVFLLLIPQLLLPVLVFGFVKYFAGLYPAVITVAVIGFIGFFLKDKILEHIVKVYKIEKYSTLEAFRKVES